MLSIVFLLFSVYCKYHYIQYAAEDLFLAADLFMWWREIQIACNKNILHNHIIDDISLSLSLHWQDSNPISSIKLGYHGEGYSLMQNTGDNGWHFFLKTPNRTYHLIAAEEHERTGWITAIHKVCNHIGTIKTRRLTACSLLGCKYWSLKLLIEVCHTVLQKVKGPKLFNFKTDGQEIWAYIYGLMEQQCACVQCLKQGRPSGPMPIKYNCRTVKASL